MKKNKEIMILAAAFILALPVIFIIPVFSVPEYTLIRNTLGELGAQYAPNAWIINFIFVSLGSGSVIAGWRHLNSYMLHRIILVLFGIFLVLIAFFNHAPINPDIRFNAEEDGWHTYFKYSSVLSFVILSIVTGLIQNNKQDKLLAIAAGISAIFLSIMMSEAERFAGVWDRLLFLIMFGWLIYNFRNRYPNNYRQDVKQKPDY